MAKKSAFSFDEKWFLDKGYIKDKDGSWHPPAFKSPFRNSMSVDIDKFGLSIDKYTSLPNDINAPKIDKIDYQYHSSIIVNDLVSLGYKSKPIAVFNITPIGAPRMTKSDKWKLDPFHEDSNKRQRKPVTQYFRFKRDIQAQALQQGFKMPENGFHVIFVIPMPFSWSDKKKSLMDMTPHQQKPDADNMIKAVKDSLCKNDANIWDYRITKYWGRSGIITIYNL